MSIRTTTRTVTFSHPFRLHGIDGVQAPGSYVVDTDEEQIATISFLAWRRVATTIHLTREGARQVWPIDPVDLEATLLRDAGRTIESSSRD